MRFGWATVAGRDGGGESEIALIRLFAASVITTALLAAPVGNAVESCVGLRQPVDGPINRSFAPIGRYSGHWGVDWFVPEATRVRAAGAGTVSFAGSVAGNLTATVDHGGGLRTSYSYLATVAVEPGQPVTESTTVGTSGAGHGSPALHFSVRMGAMYVDPLAVIGCHLSPPSRALRLVPTREPN